MKAPEFKKEYANKLKELGVCKQFMDNLESQTVSDIQLDYISRAPDFHQFVQRSFLWEPTPEGWTYWKELSYK